MPVTVPVDALTANRRKKQIPRLIPNPLDKATIVSILPLEVIELKPTLMPGKFVIPSGTTESPSVLVIGPSSSFMEMPNDGPTMEIPNAATVMAHSIIRDWCIGLPECDMDGSMPGLFYTEGTVSAKDVKEKFKAKIAEMDEKQKNWFHKLVRQADAMWARTNGNPLVIWDLMRLAARALNMNEKPWLSNFQLIEKIKCFACGTLRDPGYPVCPSCKAIDPAHAKAKDLKFAI